MRGADNKFPVLILVAVCEAHCRHLCHGTLVNASIGETARGDFIVAQVEPRGKLGGYLSLGDHPHP